MGKLKSVRFKVGNSPYRAGELAGFTPNEAAKLVKKGVAEYPQGTDEPAATPPPEAPPPEALEPKATKKKATKKKKA